MKITRILFPTDFSEPADNALYFALEISLKYHAELTLFHVIETPFNLPHDSNKIPESHLEKAQTVLEQTAEEIREKKRYRDLNVNKIIQNGNVVTAIMEQLETGSFDLVVMGTKGASGMSRILYGSITSHIVLDASVPVMAIPANVHRAAFDPLVLATDYRPQDHQALRLLQNWGERFRSEIHVLHVAESHNFQTDLNFRGFRDLVQSETGGSYPGISFELQLDRNLLTGIADYLTEHEVGLLVLVRYQKNRIETLLGKDHTRQLSQYTKVPLLVMPAEYITASAAHPVSG